MKASLNPGRFHRLIPMLAALIMLLTGCSKASVANIIIGSEAGKKEQLAASEIRKYIYLRTGELPVITKWDGKPGFPGNSILVGSKSSAIIKASGTEVPDLEEDAFLLKTTNLKGSKLLIVCGGSETGTLYAAYQLAEELGIGFYLDGDIIPDKKVKFSFPDLDIKKSPLFSRRGIQPFHDFPEGPDWWNREDYRAVLAQLPKLKMNFFGMHTYPEGGVGPEPLTWIGLPENVNTDGTVRSAYHSRHYTTFGGSWGTAPKKTSDFSFGAGQLFSRDDFGADYMKGRTPWPAEADETNLLNEMGAFLSDVLSFAKDLNIKTCLGTEIPLVLPDKFIKELKSKGLDPESPEVREKIYEGIFTRIKNTHPLDFYWFWTPEGWTWSGNSKKDIDNTARDFNAAIKALEIVKPGFSLATCGWVLGPAADRAMFDKYLPKDIPFSCINQNLGWTPVDTAFVKISDREKWAIPWMEDDPGLTAPQFWAGRMRRDAADAYAYGCDGLFGIHWRTRELSMNVSSLAKAAWDQPWNPEQGKRISVDGIQQYLGEMEGPDHKKRDSECSDFYKDWCRIQFGPEKSGEIAAIFSSLDGVTAKSKNLQSDLSRLPRPADWINGPGGIAKKSYPADSVKFRFGFIDELEKFRPGISGSGNLNRFDYWLNQFRYLRSFEMLACTLGKCNKEADEIKKMKHEDQIKAVNERLLPLFREEGTELREIHKYLISSVSTWGGIGDIANWQQHNIEGQIMPLMRQVINLTGDSAFLKDVFSDNIPEISRIIVPSPETTIREGSNYTVKVICFNIKPQTAKIFWRQLGATEYSSAGLKSTAATWYQADIPASEIKGDFEYHIVVEDGKKYIYPVTAPEIDQAVVILRK
jgi:hypothetical protein